MEMNNYPRRLLITAKPQPEESFTGYVLRLTELNLYEHPTWILELAGAQGIWGGEKVFVYLREGSDWARLSEVTGC